MKRYLLTLALTALLLTTSNGFAQQQLKTELKLGLSNVLRYNGVAKDLELTEEQNDRLMGLWIEVKTKLERAFRDYQANYSPRFTEKEQQELTDKLKQAIEEVREAESDKLNEVLLPAQVKRLKQIQLQILKRDSDGFDGLEEALKLTREQLKEIEKVRANLKKTIQELRQYARKEQLTQNEITEEVKAIREQTEKDLLEVLTPAQRRKLKELEGEKFEVQIGPAKKKKQ